MDKMNPEAKAKLVAALRSDEYAQGRNALARRASHEATWELCCLGVACVVFGTYDLNDASPHDHAYNFSGETYYLPENIQAITNLPSQPIFTIPRTRAAALSAEYPQVPMQAWAYRFDAEGNPTGHVGMYWHKLNDYGMPFSVIADLIEEYA
jgi:hypothetical protein